MLRDFVLLDLLPAFDTVDHSFCCGGFRLISVSGVRFWPGSNLTWKSHPICLDWQRYFSDCDIPQGSILDPLLSLLSLFLSEISCLSITLEFDNTLIFQTNIKAVVNHRFTLYETTPRFYHMKLRNFSRCFGCKVITPTSSMNQSEFRVINLLKAREKRCVQCAIKRNNPEIIFAKNGQLNLVLVLVLEPKGPSYKLV